VRGRLVAHLGEREGGRRVAEALAPPGVGHHAVARVEVHAEEVGLRGDQLEISFPHREGSVSLLVVAPDRLGIAAPVDGTVVEAGIEIACELGRRGALGRVVVGLEAGVGVGDANLALPARGAEGLDREAVGEEQVVDGASGDGEVADPRGEKPDAVTQIRADARLVVGDPARCAVSEALEEERSVVGEAVRRLAAGPAAEILEGLGKVPVIQGDAGVDPAARSSSTSRE
jgi:hypothetical protein